MTATAATLTPPELVDVVDKDRNARIDMELCDECGKARVRAKHIVEKGSMELFFCEHHARKNLAKLTEQGFKVFPTVVTF